MTGVSKVFPNAEHRECIWHLVQNFKKKFCGKVFDQHLWAVVILGIHICLKSISTSWMKQIQQQ
jgi:hypothetical protein